MADNLGNDYSLLMLSPSEPCKVDTCKPDALDYC